MGDGGSRGIGRGGGVAPIKSRQRAKKGHIFLASFGLSAINQYFLANCALCSYAICSLVICSAVRPSAAKVSAVQLNHLQLEANKIGP